MSNDKLQDKYNEVFQEMKEEKMNWDFEDFLKQAEESKNNGKIIPVKTSEKKPTPPKFFWLAASIALILGLFFLTKTFNNKPSVEEQDAFVKNQILIQKQEEDLLAATEIKNQDSVDAAAREQDSVVQNMSPEKEAEEVMNKILSKKSRMKKAVRQKYVSAEPKAKLEENQITIKPKKPEYQENFVIINGQKIENEKEAIDVAKYSLQMLSSQVSKTVAKAEPLTDFTE